MQREEILRKLKGYVSSELLEGNKTGLDETTPLLQWGILDSIGMVSLLSYIEESLGIEVPDENVRPEFFETLGQLSDMLIDLRTAA